MNRDLLELIGVLLVIIGYITDRVVSKQAADKELNKNIQAVKETASKDLQAAKDEGEAKRNRLYERLDEVKKYYSERIEKIELDYRDSMERFKKEVASSFTTIALCRAMHENGEKSNAEYKASIEKIIGEIKEQQGKIFDQLHEINQKIPLIKKR